MLMRQGSFVRQFWDGRRPSGYCPTAREAYVLLGKELPEGDKEDGSKENQRPQER